MAVRQVHWNADWRIHGLDDAVFCRPAPLPRARAWPLTHRALRAEDACAPLPPSIASLKSMKDLAKPITVDERAARQEKARQLMAANRLDAILLADGTSLNYFAGVHWWGSERLFALVLPAKGDALCVCPAFEEGRARELLANSPEGKNADVRTWQEDQNPYQLLAQGLDRPEDLHRQAGHGRIRALRLQRCHRQSRAATADCECDSGHRRLPHDQE